MASFRSLPDRKTLTVGCDRHGFTVLELLALVAIISVLVYFMISVINHTTRCHPPEHRTQTALHDIQSAIMLCVAETGNAPSDVDELPKLAGKYIEVSSNANEILTQLVMTGTDYWGNRLVVQPIPDQDGRYTLRSLGPDGVLGTDDISDDLVISYTAAADRGTEHEPANNSVNRSGETGGI